MPRLLEPLCQLASQLHGRLSVWLPNNLPQRGAISVKTRGSTGVVA